MKSRLRPSLLRCSRGAAALEAAIILPLIVLFILGTMDLHMRFRAQSITDLASTSVAQSLAMQQAVYAEPDCTAANAICVYDQLAPHLFKPLNFTTNGRLRITVLQAQPGTGSGPNPSAVWATGSGWPVNYGNQGLTANRLDDRASLPAPQMAGDTLILVETLYLYEPITLSAGFWEALTGTSTMYSRSVAKPRFGSLAELAPAPDDN